MAQVKWAFYGSSAPSGQTGNMAYSFDLTLSFTGSATSGPVTGISGSVSGDPLHRAKFTGGSAITGLSSKGGASNVVADSNPYVDSNGLSFTDAAGYSFNIFSDYGRIQMYIYNENGAQADIGYITTTVFLPGG